MNTSRNATALGRGDNVAATARKLETVQALVDAYGDAVMPIRLDVTDRAADFAAVERAAGHFGKLDVVINNAGYGHFGMIEEPTEDEVRSQLEATFFGALWQDPDRGRDERLRVTSRDSECVATCLDRSLRGIGDTLHVAIASRANQQWRFSAVH